MTLPAEQPASPADQPGGARGDAGRGPAPDDRRAGPAGPACAAPGRRAVHRTPGRHRGRVPRAPPGAGHPGRGVDRGHAGRRGELAARAVPAGRDGRVGHPGRPGPAARPPGRRHLHRRGQGRRGGRPGRLARRGHGDLRRRADAQPAAPAGRRGQGEGHRPDRADPGHLRPARPEQGGQGPGRAGPAGVPAAPAAWLGRVAVPAGGRPGGRRWRDRHPGPWRDEDRDRPAPDPDPDRAAAPPAGRDVGRPPGAAPAAAQPGTSRRWPSPATPTRASRAC